jgi:APA family basic amino acid/polyamine antiporter
MIPVAFAYGGWQTATFIAGEMRDPRRDLSRGLIIGVLGVVVLYLAVNVVCLGVLGAEGLDHTSTPASDLMRKALGERGAQWIAAGIAISTLGFLSQSMLTAPRVYYAMARDGSFFKSVGRLSERSGAPVIAILLQGAAATIVACSGTYGQILNFEVTVDFISFALTALAIFVLRRRHVGDESNVRKTPGHPITTVLFALACFGIVASAVVSTPINSMIALLIMLSGIPVYGYWRRLSSRTSP